MTRLTGTILLSIALCAVATLAVSSSDRGKGLRPTETAHEPYVQPLTPETPLGKPA